MSIVFDDEHVVSHDVVMIPKDDDDLEWFCASLLLCLHHHVVDDSIRHTGYRQFYVKWFDKVDGTTHDTIGTTTLVTDYLKAHHVSTGVCNYVPPNRGIDIQQRKKDGILIHRQIECILNGFHRTGMPQQIISYLTTHVDNKLIPWRTEMPIRSCNESRVVGVVDALFVPVEYRGVPTDGVLHLHMKDWKYSDCVTSCLEEYSLQLNMYKYILETYYVVDQPNSFVFNGQHFTRICIDSMELVVFARDNSYRIYHIQSNSDTVRKVLEERMIVQKKENATL
jgi:hypothetical protein